MHALVLHNMGDPARWREAIADFELAYPRYASDVRCIVHDVSVPIPHYVRDFPFDLIVINSTVLGAVTDHRTLAAVRQRLAFLENSPSFKLALPQDDYYCCEEIDRLMVEWRIDLVHTVCPHSWDTLYQRYLARGGDLRLGFTGYVTPRMRGLTSLSVASDARHFDVVYRATGRPGFPNRLAMVKAELGRHFLREFGAEDWKLDITTDDSRVITGRAWWKFLSDSRVTLGSNSGSSTLIRNLGVAQRIREYMTRYPEADPQEVVGSCVPAGDRELCFTAISPRVIEAALVETTQLLVPGEYSGVLEPGTHYWPLAEDCSNRTEVRHLLRDRVLQARLARDCKEAIMETPVLQVENFIAGVNEVAGQRRLAASEGKFDKVNIRYRSEIGMSTRRRYKRMAHRAILADQERSRQHRDGYVPGVQGPPAWMLAAYHAVKARWRT